MLHALETVRSGMPSSRHAVYLNAGTWGPLPTRAAVAPIRKLPPPGSGPVSALDDH